MVYPTNYTAGPLANRELYCAAVAGTKPMTFFRNFISVSFSSLFAIDIHLNHSLNLLQTRCHCLKGQATTMPSSSKAPKQTHAVQAGTASSSRLDAPPNSPTKQLSNHTSSVAASPASSTNPVVHQKAPATAQSDVAGDPVQPLAQQAITLEHMKQFVELLKGAIVSPTQAQREPKSDSSPLSGEPTTGKKTTGHSRGSKLECKSIREV